ncbi:MAG: carboxypeptidase-like regulatory domain-containing protein, partial [Acidobacteriota bacterium]
ADRGEAVDAHKRANAQDKIAIGGDEDDVTLESGADGRFAARLTADGLLDVEVARPGFAELRLEGIVVSGADDRNDLGDLVLERASPVAGRVVVAGEDGAPIADAEIFLFAPDFERFEALGRYLQFRTADARTGADGRFTVDGLHAGDTVALVVRRPGYARRHLPAVVAPDEEVLVRLDPAATLSGVVRLPDGEPARRAEVFLRRPFAIDPTGQLKVRTETDGAFSIPEVAFGEVELWARALGYPAARLGVEVVGDIDDLVIDLDGGFRLTGTVLDRDGVPVGGAAVRAVRVQVEDEGPTLDRPSIFNTRPDGRFALEGIAPGPWNLVVSRNWLEVERPVTVSSDLEIEIVLDGPGESIDGAVLDTAGAGVEGVRLELRSAGGEASTVTAVSAVSKVGGAFRFERVEAGTYLVRTAFSPSRVSVPVALAEDPGPVDVDGDPSTVESALEVRVTTGAVLRGRVTGVPAHQRARVRVQAFGERSIYSRGRIRIDADGGYEVDRLAIGRWRLAATVPGTGRRAVGEVLIEAGQAEATLDLEFGVGATLAGQILADGAPLAGVAVVVTDASGLKTRVRTGADGGYTVDALTPGPTVVRVDVEGPAVERRLGVGGDVRLDIDLLADGLGRP